MKYDYEIGIVGGGAAGYAAGIYAGRSGAKAVIFDKGIGGGLAMTAPKVENYPGFKDINGIENKSPPESEIRRANVVYVV